MLAQIWQIVLHTPLWVWPLLVGLIVLGLIQARDRNVPGAVVVALPVFMVAYSAYGVIVTFGPAPRALVAWLLGILSAIALNQFVFGMPAGVLRDKSEWRFAIPGSLIPLALIMAIFSTRFGLGILSSMSPATVAGPAFLMLASYWLGLCSGFFPARTLRILRPAQA